jgi:molybdenum cofactor cytidylyltransferase
MRLNQALRLNRSTRLALVGAGGKTTALFQAARQMAAEAGDLPVLISATTHLGSWQLEQASQHFIIQEKSQLTSLEDELPSGCLLFTGPPAEDQRAAGLSEDSLAELNRIAARHHLPVLLEADGSRQRPLKAPAEHEPAIPGWINLVVVVAGLAALGQPLEPQWVHRPERFGQLAGLAAGQVITNEHVARLMTAQLGGLKNIPAGARRVALLNQADTPELQARGQELARWIMPAYDAVLICSLLAPFEAEAVLAAHERVAGIVLAGGEASRFGQLKQLLPWQGEPLVRRAARTALEAGLSPVVVVSGAQAAMVEAAVSDLPVQIARNPDWAAGQSTSVVTGVRALPPQTGAAIFLLADQPQVSTTLLRSLVEERAVSLPAILAPLVNGQRSNPVLFDRQTFPDLLELTGDTGGRALFSRYRVAWLPWHNSEPLTDIDTPQDYQRLLDQQDDRQK